MLGLCERYSNSTQEAEDCMMEGFLNVFKHIEQFQFRSSLETWIRQIMTRVILDHYRIRQRRITTEAMKESHDIPAEDDDWEESISTKLHVKMILERMQKMPETQRLIFNLHTIDDMTFREIAGVLEMNENTVRANYQRARTWLKNKLGNMEK